MRRIAVARWVLCEQRGRLGLGEAGFDFKRVAVRAGAVGHVMSFRMAGKTRRLMEAQAALHQVVSFGRERNP
ncbi:MAG: hypothetical protein C7B45_07020 [Sulfobacillus acidophilus]|uniref:Uncharacterized protein n=1 Tax=Sulfobacillus acidophilus TaxID=53633 RepID=A0A2T2WJE0_9FIRM|nr:MAG: hypothetical protein C7B45_07020 [Sulfobacillus acidophilus]